MPGDDTQNTIHLVLGKTCVARNAKIGSHTFNCFPSFNTWIWGGSPGSIE
jgi:hypothetical protein